MVVDTSAIFAIVLAEDDVAIFRRALATASSLKISAATVVEAASVCMRRGLRELEPVIDTLLADAAVQVIPFDQDQARIGREGYRRYGRGMDKAGLNFGDTFAYALAIHLSEPLLFKGNDFAQTDVTPAV